MKDHICVLTEHAIASVAKVDRTREDMDFLLLSGYKGMHDQGFNGKGVIGAVIDTGINLDHEMFKDVNVTMLSKTYYGIGKDDNGHGTHCCGTIIDLLPEIDELISIKVLDIYGGGISIKAIVNDIIEAIYEAVNRNADFISMSIGIRGHMITKYTGLLEDFHDAIKHAVSNDVAVIVACGNDGDAQWKTYPAYFEEVITVGAVDEWYSPAWFTSVSEEVDVCQVGVNVWSADYLSNKGYIAMSGTSMATPLVAAMYGLNVCKLKSIGYKGDLEPFVFLKMKMDCIDLHEPMWDNKTGVGFVTFKDDIRVIKYPYNKDALIVNGEERKITMGIKNIKVDPDNEWSEEKAVLAVREDNEIRGNPVDWKPTLPDGSIYDGVIVRS